jgi:hypothetical protein
MYSWSVQLVWNSRKLPAGHEAGQDRSEKKLESGFSERYYPTLGSKVNPARTHPASFPWPGHKILSDVQPPRKWFSC